MKEYYTIAISKR